MSNDAALRPWALAPLLALFAVAPMGCSRGHDDGSHYRLRAAIPAPGPGFEEALSQSLGVVTRPGHRVDFVNDEHVFDALVDAISHATSSAHVLSYIWKKGEASDRVVAALTAKARAGVACRVVVDAFGSSTFEQDGVGAALREAGCEVHLFRPPASSGIARNHRKLSIVDGRIGFTGGFGIRDNWLKDVDGQPRWRDTNVRVTGPVVADMQRAFADNWLEAGGSLLPTEAFPAIEPDGPVRAAFVASTASAVGTRAERLVQLVIASAQKRLWLENAYFVPPDAVMGALSAKARGGLDVRLLTPGKKSDSKPSFLMQKNEYGDLIKDHVHVFEYAPTMMHAKTMLVDDMLAVIGSVNLEPLSMHSLEEAALVLEDPEVAHALEAQFVDDTHRSNDLSGRKK